MTMSEMLLRGCMLKNSHYVVGGRHANSCMAGGNALARGARDRCTCCAGAGCIALCQA